MVQGGGWATGAGSVKRHGCRCSRETKETDQGWQELLPFPLTAPFLLRFTSVPGGTGISMGGVTAFLMPWFFLGPLLPTAGLALLPRGAAYSLRLCRCSRES
jgi:hypothetical protein